MLLMSFRALTVGLGLTKTERINQAEVSSFNTLLLHLCGCLIWAGFLKLQAVVMDAVT